MSDTITLHEDGRQTVINIEPKKDPYRPGQYLLESADGQPMCCELSLKDRSYNIMLLPGSRVIIGADRSEMFKEWFSDDRVIFSLPSDDPAQFYMEKYVANAKHSAPYTVVVLRGKEKHEVISAALYPRDLDKMPTPLFMTREGKTAWVTITGMSEVTETGQFQLEAPRSSRELEQILHAVFKTGHPKLEIDPDAPTDAWF